MKFHEMAVKEKNFKKKMEKFQTTKKIMQEKGIL